jgi:hypothetical protein
LNKNGTSASDNHAWKTTAIWQASIFGAVLVHGLNLDLKSRYWWMTNKTPMNAAGIMAVNPFHPTEFAISSIRYAILSILGLGKA